MSVTWLQLLHSGYLAGWNRDYCKCLSTVLFNILRNIKPLDNTLVGRGISQMNPKIFGILHNMSLVIVFMNSLCLTWYFVEASACFYWAVWELRLILKLIQEFSVWFYGVNVTQVSGGENNTSSWTAAHAGSLNPNSRHSCDSSRQGPAEWNSWFPCCIWKSNLILCKPH